MKQLVVQVDAETKENLIKKFKETAKYYNDAIEHTHSITNDLINKVSSLSIALLSKLRQKQNLIKRLFSLVIKDKPVDIEILEKFNKEYDCQLKDFKIDPNEIYQKMEYLFDLNNTCCTQSFHTDFMFYFESNSVKVVDLRTLKHIQPFFSINSNICYGSAVAIEKNTYFVHGSYYDEKSKCRIIDFNSNKVTMTSDGEEIGMSGMCFVKNFVYSFGGWLVANSRKYNLESRQWSYISSLPAAIGRVTTSYFSNDIYVIGFQSPTLFRYDINKNSFSNSINFTGESYKYIFENWIVVFGGYLYYTKDFKVAEQRHKVDESGNNLTIFSSFKRDKFIYFIIYNNIFYRINTTTGSLEKVNIT